MRQRLGLGLRVVVLALVVGPVPVAAQIVNTLGGWDTGRRGWSGKIGLAGDLSGGNTNVKGVAGAARVQWAEESQWLRLLGSFKVEEAEDVRVKEESMAHARVSRRLSERVVPFAFTQLQRNPFRRLETRWLLGGGVELDLVPAPAWTLSLGLSPMLEAEKIQDTGAGNEIRGRFSSFLKLDLPLGRDVAFEVVGFYQPRLAEVRDFRSSVVGSLELPLVGSLQFLVLGKWEHDDAPPPAVEPDDWDLDFGLTLSL